MRQAENQFTNESVDVLSPIEVIQLGKKRWLKVFNYVIPVEDLSPKTENNEYVFGTYVFSEPEEIEAIDNWFNQNKPIAKYERDMSENVKGDNK